VAASGDTAGCPPSSPYKDTFMFVDIADPAPKGKPLVIILRAR
jgi:hypothetical protein